MRRITRFNTEWWFCEDCREHGVISGDLPATCFSCSGEKVRKMTARDWNSDRLNEDPDFSPPPLDAA